jgi:hypothetical protein
MSNNEYEQQQFWKEDKDPWKEFAKAVSDYITIRYDPKYYKSALSMLTENHKNDNPTPYEWKLMGNYEYHKNKLDGK